MTIKSKKAHWEKIYTDLLPEEVSWYQKEPTLSLELIRRAGLGPDGAIIDIGGGASVLVDGLLAAGYRNVTVLDLSAHALAHATQRLGVRAKQVEWIEADVTEVVLPRVYDLWHDRAVFHFLTEAGDRMKYLETMKRSVRDGGHAIMATFAIGGPTKCSGLEVVQYDAQKLSGELGSEFTLIDQRAERHVTPTGKDQQFNYFLYRRA
jgi:ubiquinone/menaquinone biosynthesis C-methylase UbiE